MAYEGDAGYGVSATPLPRALFEVTAHYTYLNHAAVGVLPTTSRDALKAFTDAHAAGGVMGTWPIEARMPEFRDAVGRFVGASGDDIAILRNTADGANAIAAGFDWHEGDEVLLAQNEFPSNALPWFALRARGVHPRIASARRLTPDALRAELGDRTRIVALSWVSFLDGYRHDLTALADAAHERGALLVVDGIQGLGAFPLDVRSCGIDAFYCGGAKWMLALQGVSFLYLRSELRDALAVAAPGWRSARGMWQFLDYEQPYAKEAYKFEGGTPNFIGALSLARAIEMFERYEPRRIASHILELTDQLYDGLVARGATVLTERGEGMSSGIVTFTMPGADPVELGKALGREGIITTYRDTGIRVSPHGYNTREEIALLFETLDRVKKHGVCSP